MTSEIRIPVNYCYFVNWMGFRSDNASIESKVVVIPNLAVVLCRIPIGYPAKPNVESFILPVTLSQ